ncbi:MAG: methyltransferase [Sphingobacteriaceae bacterium]|nr:methyltransferase [Cytophagaceae bacterium]
MKVSTEACLLGAWAPIGNAERVLDIGTGTGLLALMLAQRQPAATIDAVEIDEAAARQAAENVAASPFADRIRVVKGTIQKYEAGDKKYDLIISNPPFYQQSLRSPDAARSGVLHATTLTFSDLLDAVDRLLAPDGKFVVLLPKHETRYLLVKAAGRGLCLHKQLRVYPQPDGQLFRQISVLGRRIQSVRFQDLCIHDSSGNYALEYVRLLKEFYLKF